MPPRPLVALLVALALLVASGVLVPAAPRESAPRPDQTAALPPYLRRVEPAVVGIHVRVPRDRPSTATLGSERRGSGVIFDAQAGYALTVSYLLLDADRVDVKIRDGRNVAAKVVGLDLEVGLGVMKLQGPGPWPAAAFGDSSKVAVGDVTGTIGVADDGGVVANASRIEAVRSFVASWEYMLDRAFFVSPHNAAFGGGALVNASGNVIGITSLRLGEAPYVNLAIPIEKFLPGKDELVGKGRVVSRRPRPWLGLYTVAPEGGGVLVAGVSPVGPARAAGFRRGDRIVKMNGVKIESQQDFYSRLWQGAVDQEVNIVVQRDARFEAITVRPADRYGVYRTSDR